jgi:hypothetical protein
MTAPQIGAVAAAAAVAYLAAASRFTGTGLCPKWWERFVLNRKQG